MNDKEEIYKKLKNIRKIGVYVNVPGLGDMLFIIPLFRALKKGFPDAEVIFIGRMGREYVAPVLERCPYIDSMMEYDFYYPRDMRHHLKFILQMRRERFDLFVDTQRKFLPSLILVLGGARYRVGYSAGGVFSHFAVKTENRKGRHTADVSLDLARALGLEVSAELEVNMSGENLKNAEEFYTDRGIVKGNRLAGLITSAGIADKCWDVEKFGELARRFSSDGYRVVCFGAPEDQAVIDAVRSHAGIPLIEANYEGKSVLDTAAMMRWCEVIVGNDSGPLHLADAVGAACVGIYGPSLPARFGLFGKKTKTICLNVDCAPCSDERCEYRKCLAEISVDEVYKAAMELISQSKGV
ncbi:MAG: glycosyltransferase family 9 protein [bacterium]